MRYTSKTDIGLKRENNEDCLFAKIYDEDNALFIVADGLGGYSSGEIASQTVAKSVREDFEAKLDVLKTGEKKKVKEYLAKIVLNANNKVYSMQTSNPKYKGMGTTIVLVAKISGDIYYLSIGDSRLYYIDERKENIEQITIDDTYVNELLKKNLIKEEEAEKHPQKHVLTKALGIFSKLEIKVHDFYKTSGYLLLCSDGLTNMLSNEEILEKLLVTPEDKIAEKYINEANAKGGRDNITVIVVEI